MSNYKYQIKEEIRGDGKSLFLPMFTDIDICDDYYTIEPYGRWYNSHDEALEIITEHKETLLHSIVVETKIHPIE